MVKDKQFWLLLTAIGLLVFPSALAAIDLFKPGFLQTYKLWKILLLAFFIFLISLLIKN